MTYARNAWYVAAWISELPEGKPFAITILGDRLVIYRHSGGLTALEDRCVHRMAALSLGRCEGDKLRCMYHGMLFNPDGTAAEIPGQAIIPPNAKVKSYPIVESGGWAWVWMGDAAAPDLSVLPQTTGPDHPDYIMGHGQLDYEADARLINDNLLDFSHLSFVHANSFQVGDDFANSLPTLETIERGVRFSRWVVNADGVVGRDAGMLVDNYMSYDFIIPGILQMWNGSFPTGTAAACNMGKPDYDQAISGITYNSQAVTPMTDGTARYFFAWGPHKDHGDEALRDVLMGIAEQAFFEDKVMIESQHKVIQSTPDPKIMPTAHDRGVTIFNRMVEKLAREGEKVS